MSELMSESIRWTVGLGLGAVAALLYFGGLWLTVRKLPKAQHPLRRYVVSLLVRLSVLGIFFACMLRGSWQQLLAAAVAFLLVRFVIVYAVAGRPGGHAMQPLLSQK